jgi:MscS family membrane protein
LRSDFQKLDYSSIADWLAQLDWSRILAALAVVFVVMLTRRHLANFSLSFFHRALAHFDIQFSKTLSAAIQPAAELFIFALGLIAALGISKPPGQFGDNLGNLAVSVLVASIFFAFYQSTALFASLLHARSQDQTPMDVGWVDMTLKVIAAVLGLGSVLKIWGIDLGSLITGVGIAGAAAAFAAQDLLRNLIGGMSNMAERRFDVGDWIRAEGVVEGTVERVALRSTAVRQFDMSLVHIPNSDLANAALINMSRMKHRRIYITIQLLHSTSSAQLHSITSLIKNYISQNDAIVQAPGASQYVCVESFSNTSIDVMVYCFTASTAYDEYIEVKEDLIFEIKRLVEDTGARFAHESRTIYIDNAADLDSERDQV